MNKNFVKCLNHVREKLKDKDLSYYTGLIFFGECMVKHTIDYDWKTIPPFLGFDICDTTRDYSFFQPLEMENIYRELGLETVPLIKTVKAGEIKEVTDDEVPKSKYYGGQAEGIVFKNPSKQIYAKYVRAVFKEKNREEFGGNKKHAKTDEEYFTLLYCTNAIIEKNIWKLIDDGEELQLQIMPKLVKKVYDDIWEENWKEISHTKNKTISFDKLRIDFTKRCFIVLKNIIVNNALQKS